LEEAKLEEQKIVDDRHLLELRLKHEVDKIKVNNFGILFVMCFTKANC